MTLDRDAWLSELMGKDAYHWSGPFEKAPGDASIFAGQRDIFCDAKVAAGQTVAACVLKDLGFFLADTNLYFEADPLTSRKGGALIRPATSADATAVGEIAESSFSCSRFHKDPFISPETANAIKRSWAMNYFKGTRGDMMLVAESPFGVSGFVQLLKKQDGLWIIDLIAVHGRNRGQGVGAALIEGISSCCPGVRRIGVGTQAANQAAMSFYAHQGFVLTKVTNVFHFHGGRS